MIEPKVFGIGFHKTGTSSLGEALELLGYRVKGPFGISDPKIGEHVLDRARLIVPQYDAFQDNPWPIVFRELDEEYPGSKFILTLREPDEWIGSQVRHFGKSKTLMREWIYGVGFPAGNEKVYLDRYLQHNRDVLAHFSARPDDLLPLRITGGDGWEKLCPFLGHEVPDAAFPHANDAAEREVREKVRGRGKGLLRRLMGRPDKK